MDERDGSLTVEKDVKQQFHKEDFGSRFERGKIEGLYAQKVNKRIF